MADFNYANEATLTALIAEIRKRVPFYAVCSTEASIAAKTIADLTGFELRTGATIRVKFTYGNTASNPTLAVNGSEAKNIYKYGTERPGDSVNTSWQNDAVVTLTYDGTAWMMNSVSAEIDMAYPIGSIYTGSSSTAPDFPNTYWQEVVPSATVAQIKAGSMDYVAGTGTGNVHHWRRIPAPPTGGDEP